MKVRVPVEESAGPAEQAQLSLLTTSYVTAWLDSVARPTQMFVAQVSRVGPRILVYFYVAAGGERRRIVLR